MRAKSLFDTIGHVSKDVWIPDSGATNHMTMFLMFFNSYFKMNKEQLFTVANGDRIHIYRSRNITLESFIQLKDVLHVPQSAHSLISIQKLTKDLNCLITFFSSQCLLRPWHEEDNFNC